MSLDKMAYYQTPDSKLHFIENASFEYLLPDDAVAIADEQAATIINPPETAEQTIKRLEAALDRHLDEVANSYRYESIRTMVTYATSEHEIFGPEGRAAVAFRDAVYAYGIQKIADCTREIDPDPIPTEAELIAGLPAFETFLQP